MQVRGRYVRSNSVIYRDSHCLYCGAHCGICKGEARACRVTTCVACGSDQCMSNGLGNGQCSVCYVGLLPGWSRFERPCRYSGCKAQAVAQDGKWSVCAVHLEKRKPGYVEKQIEARDRGAWTMKPAADVPIL